FCNCLVTIEMDMHIELLALQGPKSQVEPIFARALMSEHMQVDHLASRVTEASSSLDIRVPAQPCQFERGHGCWLDDDQSGNTAEHQVGAVIAHSHGLKV